MSIVGLNLGETSFGKKLRLGGTAALLPGGMITLHEERITGTKYAGGYKESLHSLLEQGLVRPDEVDTVAISSCCEPRPDPDRFTDGIFPNAEVVSVGHHESHAELAFRMSGYNRALVCVVDSGGDVLEPMTTPDWWTFRREQSSYYVADERGVELISQDFVDPFEVGLGEFYRAATYFLGWDSSRYSARTMALAGHGTVPQSWPRAFNLDADGRLRCPVRNAPSDPVGMILKLGESLGIDFGEPRARDGAFLHIHKSFAAWAQLSIETALIDKIAQLRQGLDISHVCLAGGVALNVVANSRVSTALRVEAYVPSAPGDEGQCLGNALVALRRRGDGKELPVSPMRTSSSAYLGPKVELNSAAVADALSRCEGASKWVVFEVEDQPSIVASLVQHGQAVCLYQERSEFGPRALGARSIIADPRDSEAQKRLNKLKARDWFQPFAPAVLSEHADEWFPGGRQSPFMSFAAWAPAQVCSSIPAVVNHDRSGRLQVVGPDDGRLRSIMERFYDLTGVPLLLNTSFNLGGHPIVETLEQAIESFSRMAVNVMSVGRFIMVKSLSPDEGDLPIPSGLDGLAANVWRGGESKRVKTTNAQPLSFIRSLQRMTETVVFVRSELPLFGEYLEWMREGRKVTTIRFRKGALEVPTRNELPLFETLDFGPGSRDKPVDHVLVHGIDYRIFGELDDKDAQKDGFRDRDDMRQGLRAIYPKLEDEDWVTIYTLSLKSKSEASA